MVNKLSETHMIRESQARMKIVSESRCKRFPKLSG